MTVWPQYLVASTMVLAVVSVVERTRDDEPYERIAAFFGTVIICGLIVGALAAGGFWGPTVRP